MPDSFALNEVEIMTDTTENQRPSERKAVKKLWQYLMLVLGGILLNLVLAQTAGKLKLPVYLDSIGTILVSMVGGFVPGIVTGYATNLLKLFFDADSVYYCAINVLIAVLAALLQRKKWFANRW